MNTGNNIPNYFGERLKTVMRERDLTIYDVAEGANIAPSSVSKYINGKVTPRPKAIKKVADYLNLDPSYFYNLSHIEKVRARPGIYLGDEFKGSAEALEHLIEKVVDTVFNEITDNNLIDREVQESKQVKIQLDTKESKLLTIFKQLPTEKQDEVIAFAEFKKKQ